MNIWFGNANFGYFKIFNFFDLCFRNKPKTLVFSIVANNIWIILKITNSRMEHLVFEIKFQDYIYKLFKIRAIIFEIYILNYWNISIHTF